MTVKITRPGEGETFPAGPVELRILEDGAEVDGRVGVFECWLSPGWGGPPQHVHCQHDETFLAIEGQMTV